MPARDWDKLRRQDRASGDYHSLTGRDYSAYKRKARHRSKRHSSRPQLTQVKAASKPLPPAARWLVVQIGDVFATSVFVRSATANSWRCTGSDHPDTRWFTGVLHMQVINDWITRHHYPFRWLSTNPVRTAQKERTEHTPAEAYPPSQASPESSPNTGVSLNPNPSGVSMPGALPASRLAQTGVTTSLLLNSSHHPSPTAV